MFTELQNYRYLAYQKTVQHNLTISNNINPLSDFCQRAHVDNKETVNNVDNVDNVDNMVNVDIIFNICHMAVMTYDIYVNIIYVNMGVYGTIDT